MYCGEHQEPILKIEYSRRKPDLVVKPAAKSAIAAAIGFTSAWIPPVTGRTDIGWSVMKAGRDRALCRLSEIAG
jgi:hypothetical protein